MSELVAADYKLLVYDTGSFFVDFSIRRGRAVPPDTFEDLTPDEQPFHEATGNEGASFEGVRRGPSQRLR